MLVVLLFTLPQAAAEICGGKPSDTFPPYTKLFGYDEAVECMLSVPGNTTWIDSTLHALNFGLQNFVFLDKMRNSGPPYNIRTDFLAELKKLGNNTYQHDLEFQEDVQSLFIKMHDAHTQYVKPLCYHATFALPFSLHNQLIMGQQRFYVEPANFTETYERFFGVKLARYFGREIVAINGLEVMTFISDFAEDMETISNDLSAAFNSALRTAMYRIQLIFPRPSTPHVSFTFGELNRSIGKLETIQFPWLVFGDDNLGNLSACTVGQSDPLKATRADYLRPTKYAGKSKRSCQEWADPVFCKFARSVPSPAGYIGTVSLYANANPILPDGRPSTISCFTKQATYGLTLVMKIRSFEPASESFDDPVELFINDALTCLQSQFDFVLIDVMQNGGGVIGLAYRLLQILVEDFWHEPTKSLYTYDLRHSSFMDMYISKTQSRSPSQDDHILDPATLKEFNSSAWYSEPVQYIRGGVLGNYSQRFTMNFSDFFEYRRSERPYKFPKKTELMVLTDGTCGSTCAHFAVILNENNLATTVGVGGIFQYTMAVSSFAGGSVSNLDDFEFLANITGLKAPHFLTTARWQFTWFELYSKTHLNDAVQFVMQNPVLRLPWWDFPNPTKPAKITAERLSKLYDLAITELGRLNPHVFSTIFI